MYESTSEEEEDGEDDGGENKSGLVDMEDLGPMMNTVKRAKVKYMKQKSAECNECNVIWIALLHL